MDVPALLVKIEQTYGAQGGKFYRTDGPGAELAEWHFNVRAYNTEPLVRLNVETRGDAKLLEEKTAEVLGLMGQ